MQQRVVISNGKRYLVNVPTEDGIGAGFALGQLVMKNTADAYWYIISATGAAGTAAVKLQSTASAFGTSSYFDINSPFQLLASTDSNTYQVYLNGGSLVVSQSMYATGSYITASNNALFYTAKPYLLLQSETDGNYYKAYLSSSGGTTTLKVDPSIISQSWVTPLY